VTRLLRALQAWLRQRCSWRYRALEAQAALTAARAEIAQLRAMLEETLAQQEARRGG
jgi:hypothetical protein